MSQNDDFKYLIQDANFIYIGRELTYGELLDMEETPFKLKAVINSYVQKDTELDKKIADHLVDIDEKSFTYKVYEQLKLSVKICYKTKKKSLFGKEREKWVHKSCRLDLLKKQYSEGIRAGEIRIEDIALSKLALMTISL